MAGRAINGMAIDACTNIKTVIEPTLSETANPFAAWARSASHAGSLRFR